jgi:hypothetical protein
MGSLFKGVARECFCFSGLTPRSIGAAGLAAERPVFQLHLVTTKAKSILQDCLAAPSAECAQGFSLDTDFGPIEP